MPFNLRHIPQAADAKSVELPVEGFRDAVADRRLPHPGGAHEAQDAPVHASPEFSNGDELQDALFDVV